MTDALLPCPFCGSIDLFVDTVDGSLPPQTGQTVSCEDCTAKTSYGDWNTRQPTHSEIFGVGDVTKHTLIVDPSYTAHTFKVKSLDDSQPTPSDAEIIAENKRLREALANLANTVNIVGSPYHKAQEALDQIVTETKRAARAALGDNK